MSFFKYTNLNTAKLILENSSLRWSSPIVFNDVEECQFVPFSRENYLQAFKDYVEILTQYASGNQSKYDFNKFSEITKTLISLFNISLTQGKHNMSDFAREMLDIVSNPEADYREYINVALIKIFRIICLTDSYDNTLMWAHYADQHYGCVLELESVYLEKPHSLKEGNVEYHENLHPKTNSLDLLLYGETIEIRNLMIRDVIFSKRTTWNYEREYRFMFAENFGQITLSRDFQLKKSEISTKYQTDKLFTDISIDKQSVKSVIFGVRTEENNIQVVKEILSKNNYKSQLFQMKIVNGKMEKLPLS